MRKEEKTRLRREKIITAALFEFATKGYQGFVINELCKVDGISKGVLYHNFSGESDLYLTCFQESFEKRAMDYLRLIQDMFRSYYLTVSSDSSLPDLVSGYEHQLSQVLDMMIYGILEEDSSKKGEK